MTAGHESLWMALLSGLGALTIVLLSVHLHRQGELDEKVDKLGEVINCHLVDAAGVESKFLKIEDCKGCVAFNQVCRKIEELKERRETRWKVQIDENKDIWSAINNHTHVGLPEDAGGVVRK